MTDIFKEWSAAKQRADPRARQAVDFAENKVAMGALGGVGAAANYMAPEVTNKVKDFAMGAKDYVVEQADQFKDATGLSMGLSAKPLSPTDSTITPKFDASVLNIPNFQGQAQATLGNEGVQDYNVQGQYNIPDSNFNLNANYGSQGGQAGAGYNNEGFSAGVSAPINTNRVSDMLENIRVGMNYTRKF
jgi:hypothetical protein